MTVIWSCVSQGMRSVGKWLDTVCEDVQTSFIGPKKWTGRTRMGRLFIIFLLAILKHCVTYNTHTMTYHKKKWWSNTFRSECHSVHGISSNINMVQNANAILAEEAMRNSFCSKLVCLQPETLYACSSLKSPFTSLFLPFLHCVSTSQDSMPNLQTLFSFLWR